MVFPDDLVAAKAAIENSFKTGSYAGEWRAGRPDGRVIWVAASATVQFDGDGRPDRMIGVNVDITARKAAEEELRKYQEHLEQLVAQRTTELSDANARLEGANQELESFSYSVSHDLRAPLRAVDGFSRILLEDYADKLDAEGQRVLNVVRDSTVKMGRMIDDILAFSRAGRLEMRPSRSIWRRWSNPRSPTNWRRPSRHASCRSKSATLPEARGDEADVAARLDEPDRQRDQVHRAKT